MSDQEHYQKPGHPHEEKLAEAGIEPAAVSLWDSHPTIGYLRYSPPHNVVESIRLVFIV